MESGQTNIHYVPPSEVPAEPDTPSLPVAAAPPPVAEPEDELLARFSPSAIQTLAPLPPAHAPGPVAGPPKSFGPFLTLKDLKDLSRKNIAILASAAAGLLILGVYLAHRGAKAAVPVRPPEIVEHLDLTELHALPEPLQAGAQALVAGNFQPPAWLQSLERGSGGDLDYPVQEAIDDLQPTLRWSSSATSYNVAVISPTHQVVARAEIFGASEWLLPVELTRGNIYTWEVSSTGQVRRNRFRVLDETESGLLNAVRTAHGESHLLMGVASLELGLVSQAQRELLALQQAHPHSPEAAQLLRTVNGLIVH
ncbi:MAG TPA: hypothetical protein VN841_01375 [Bryobacteraceae bacterium]|nr:hypothetical protein [Bryobacteraceae bacterium]